MIILPPPVVEAPPEHPEHPAHPPHPVLDAHDLAPARFAFLQFIAQHEAALQPMADRNPALHTWLGQAQGYFPQYFPTG